MCTRYIYANIRFIKKTRELSVFKLNIPSIKLKLFKILCWIITLWCPLKVTKKKHYGEFKLNIPSIELTPQCYDPTQYHKLIFFYQ